MDEQQPEIRAPQTAGWIIVRDRLLSMSISIYGWCRRQVRHFIDSITRKKYASISYRYLARELADRFAHHTGAPRIVFSCLDSLEASTDVLLMIAHFIQDETGGQVLLVDHSLRNGGVSSRFGHSSAAGFSECLYESGHSVQDYFKSTDHPGVFVLPAGKIFGRGLCSFESQSVTALLNEFNQFDYVLIQQGSITTDTRYLDFARLADLVLLVVEEGNTPVSEFEFCQKIFRDHGIQDWGVILSESDT